MSQADGILVEMYALSDMDIALSRLNRDLNEALEQAKQAVEYEIHRLERIVREREQEVRRAERQVARCQVELATCLANIDEEGRRPPCSSEYSALQEAQDALQEARNALAEARNHFHDFSTRSDEMLNNVRNGLGGMEQQIDQSQQYLDRHIQAAGEYLSNHAGTLSHEEATAFFRQIPGAGIHGSRFATARTEMHRRVGNIRPTSEFDAGHIPGRAMMDIPQFLEQEPRYNNRRQGAIARHDPDINRTFF